MSGDATTTMYRISFGGEIEPVEVVRMTASFVTYKAKPSPYRRGTTQREKHRNRYFATWALAYAEVLKRAEWSYNRLKQDLEFSAARLDRIRAMTDPTNALPSNPLVEATAARAGG